ncbi:hypothetical protein D9757_004230 [Collybiopsis confluens]|uniref:Large ribosomal subunit protein mL59 domain-containing protein n=1 Tax=Collybiopsis confluens TaxID=2823264 RepID=A0A8H5HUL7_9AGAR|nr:hypothetical protein D9757_004230 [Collybiopsis confluens]
MAAVQALKKFRLHQLKGLESHIARNGPLPAPEGPVSGVRLPNPFLPHRNPQTGRWAPPKYSLRRQAELIKNAKATNNLELLPPGPKLSAPAAAALSGRLDASVGASQKISVLDESLAFSVDWVGKFEPKTRVPSLYAGRKRMFKGHKWERVRDRKKSHRYMLLRDMDKRVAKYKKMHRKKRPDPLKTPKKWSTKLPF